MPLLMIPASEIDLLALIDTPLGRALNEVAMALAASISTNSTFAARLNAAQRTSLKVALCRQADIDLLKVERTYPQTKRDGTPHPKAGETYRVTKNPTVLQVADALTTLGLRHMSDGAKVERDGKSYLTTVLQKATEDIEDATPDDVDTTEDDS